MDLAAIDRILSGALDLPESERADFVARACGDDEALRRRVERMLDIARETSFLTPGAPLDGGAFDADELLSAVDESAARDGAADLAGTVLGPYRVDEEIGRGGMSVVYSATRVDGAFDHAVALKVIKRGVDTSEVVARFHQERQILARIDHPSIARLIDGGVTPDGRPYFVLERVTGRTLDEATRDMDLDRRLDVFLEICGAVAEAHRHLIIHRDLKPGNILLTDDGRVKLLDFGIAKVLDPEEAFEGMPRTRTMVRVMTPEYASPEQIRGEASTTATDVYQLGLVLYELLSGRRAFDDSTHLHELSRRICDEEPKPPSTAQGSVGAMGAEGNADDVDGLDEPVTRPSFPSRAVRGDLDAITLKALRKEPEHRYRSVERLAEDVERHRAGLPVRARSGSFRYRSERFVRRHRSPLAAAAGVVLLLVGLVAFYTLRIRAERDEARRQAERAERVSDLMGAMFESAAPEETLGETLSARDFLERGALAIEELDDEPAVRADLSFTLGKIFHQLGDVESATEHLETARALRAEAFGRDDPSLREVDVEIGSIHYDLGDFARAKDAFERVLANQEHELGPTDLDLADTLNRLGNVEKRLADYERAVELLERSAAIRRRHLGDDHEQVAAVLNNLGLVSYESGDLDASRRYLEQSVEVYEAALGAEHPFVANALDNLGSIVAVAGDPEAALGYHLRAHEVFTKVYGETHPDTARVLNSLGNVHENLDRLDEAVDYLERSIRAYRESTGSKLFWTSYPMSNLATIRHRQGRHDEALELLRDSHRLAEDTVGADNPWTLQLAARVARARVDTGDAEGADQAFDALLARLPDDDSPRATWRGYCLLGKARARAALGDPAEAAELARTALAWFTGREMDEMVEETETFLGEIDAAGS